MTDRPTNTIVGTIKNGFLARIMRFSPVAVMVWLALVNRANKRGRSWPSITTLMQDTGLSRSSIYKGIAELVVAGEITITEAGGGKGNPSNHYQIVQGSTRNGLVQSTDKVVQTADKVVQTADKVVRRTDPNHTQEPDSENQTQKHTHTGVCEQTASPSKPKVRLRLGEDDLADRSLAAPATGHRPGLIEQSLIAALGFSRNGESNPAWEQKLWQGGDHLNDNKFDRLPAYAQRWIDDCLDASRNGLERPSLAQAEAAAEVAAEKRVVEERAEVEQRKIRKAQDDADREKSILAGFQHFGVTAKAAKLLKDLGPDQCEEILVTCERCENRHGLTAATKLCRYFAADPSKFTPDPNEEKNYKNDAGDENDSGSLPDDEVQGVGVLPDVDYGDDGEATYQTRQELLERADAARGEA